MFDSLRAVVNEIEGIGPGLPTLAKVDRGLLSSTLLDKENRNGEIPHCRRTTELEGRGWRQCFDNLQHDR